MSLPLPSSIYLPCPTCKKETLHRVHHAVIQGKKGQKIKTIVECTFCNITREETLILPEKKDVPMVVSRGGKSRKTSISLDEDEVLEIGDILYTPQGERLKITSIEKKGTRVKTSSVGEVTTIWAKASDTVKVKVSVNKGTNTISREIKAAYDEEFCIGDILSLGDMKAVIHRIKTTEKVIRRGCARAEEIKRLYARAMKTRRR